MYIFGRNEGYIFRFDYSSDSNFLNSSMAVGHKTNEMNNNTSTNNKVKFKKEFNSTIINNANETYINLQIDKTFLPPTGSQFMLDSKKMCYVLNPSNANDIKESIKIEAIKKITKEPTIKESQISESSEFSDSQYYSQSDEHSSKNAEESANADGSISPSKTKENQNKRRGNEEYYSVNMSQIKLLIYDHSKESIVEQLDGNKISQVELKKNEDHRKKDADLVSNKEHKNSTSDQAQDVDEDIEDMNIKEGLLIKQIEYALNKEENQPTITRMKYISFFIFLLFIGVAGIFLGLFLISNYAITENINLIYNTFTLIFNTVYGLHHTRELILLNNPKYMNIYQERADYIKNNTDILLNLFSSSHNLLTSIITTPLKISTTNYDSLYNTNISTFILEENFNIKSIRLKLSSSIIETNTALYHIAHQDISEIFPTSKDVFFFMYNSINNIYNMLFKQTQIFLEELSLNVEDYKLVFLYIFAGVVGFCFIGYSLITIAYMAVGKRKESYLEVFFEIGDGVIRNSIEKCEKFTKKFQSDNITEEVSNLDEAEIINDTNTTLLANIKASRNTTKKRKNNNSKDDKIIKLKILIGLFIICLFFFVMYFIYQDYLNIIKTYLDIYNNNCNEQTYFLVIFNVLREYFFDRNTAVFGVNVSDYMYDVIDDIYKFRLERENVIIISLIS